MTCHLAGHRAILQGASLFMARTTHIELESGDPPYLPRGVLHHAVATSAVPLHLTVAVKLPRFVDRIDALSASGPKYEGLHDYLPIEWQTHQVESIDMFIKRIASAGNTSELKSSLSSLLNAKMRR